MHNHTPHKKIPGNAPGSIEKALELFEIFAIPPYEYTTPELVEKTGFNRTTIHRTLKILMSKDFIMYDSTSEKYKIGHAMYHVGTVYLYNGNYKERLLEILVEISEITKESIGMAVKKGDKIMSLLEVEIHQPMKFNDFPGKYFPPNKGCYGKCLMAYQSEEYIDQILKGQVFERPATTHLQPKKNLKKNMLGFANRATLQASTSWASTSSPSAFPFLIATIKLPPSSPLPFTDTTAGKKSSTTSARFC